MQNRVFIVGIWLLSTIQWASCTEKSAIVGVEEARQHLYQPIINEKGEQKWRCLGDSSIELSFSQINDDFCDCPDGSDEPGTNACPFNGEKTFYCANKGHFPAYIENYKLNDGVCDYDVCCDGTDEYVTGSCPNKCEEIHRQYLDFKSKKKKEIVAALSIKEQLLKKAQDKRKLVEQTMQSKLNKIQDEQKVLARKKAQLLREASDSKGEQKTSLRDILTPHVEKISSQIEKKEGKINALLKQNTLLESMLANLASNYNPNFNDLAVKEAVNGFQEYISNKDEGDQDSDAKGDLFKPILETVDKMSGGNEQVGTSEPSLSKMFQFYRNRIAGWMDQNLFNKGRDFEGDLENVNVELSRQIDKIEKNIENIYKDALTNKQDLEKGYGPDDILRSLASQWITTKLGEYNYNLGLGDSIYQDNTLIGRFVEMEGSKLFYRGGSKCWNGPNRSAVVEMICGSKNKLLSVSEPEKCEYNFQLVTPIQCYHHDLDRIQNEFKVDYSALA